MLSTPHLPFSSLFAILYLRDNWSHAIQYKIRIHQYMDKVLDKSSLCLQLRYFQLSYLQNKSVVFLNLKVNHHWNRTCYIYMAHLDAVTLAFCLMDISASYGFPSQALRALLGNILPKKKFLSLFQQSRCITVLLL